MTEQQPTGPSLRVRGARWQAAQILCWSSGQVEFYVGVTERKGTFKNSFYARASMTKRKGDKRRQYAINGAFGSAVAAAIAIADAEADPLGPASPAGDRKPRTCALPAARHLP